MKKKESPWKDESTPEVGGAQILTDLARSLQQEEDAIADYRARSKYAGDAGDVVTVELYDHVIKEEEEHAREFSRRMRELGVKP